jgi:hypothetical protein
MRRPTDRGDAETPLPQACVGQNPRMDIRRHLVAAVLLALSLGAAPVLVVAAPGASAAQVARGAGGCSDCPPPQSEPPQPMSLQEFTFRQHATDFGRAIRQASRRLERPVAGLTRRQVHGVESGFPHYAFKRVGPRSFDVAHGIYSIEVRFDRGVAPRFRFGAMAYAVS